MMYRHGHASGGVASREYKTWQSMMQRCYKPYSHNWRRYGARGIRVCDRWHVFANFLADMGPKPIGMTLERLDSDKNYSPDNCRWATVAEQNRNKSNVVNITYNGKTQCITAWAAELGVKKSTLVARLRRYNMPVEIALMGGRVKR